MPDSTVKPSQAPGYILRTTVTHSRLLPVQSRHSFTYPVLSFFVSLSELESNKLSLLNGYLFSYGGAACRITGLRASGYLYEDGGKETSIRNKLVRVIKDFGIHNAISMSDAWIMTMPSYLGYEGTNPLTVYFCYMDGRLWTIVLEIHNTFGERHVHILEIGKDEETPDRGFEHQWTFSREFHVSPFNDRAGTYTISVRAPLNPPNDPSASELYPKPAVRVHLNEPSVDTDDVKEKGPLKLTALHWTNIAAPLTTSSLVTTLIAQPFILLMTLPRILRHAYILHYNRSLGVWKRPEMQPVTRDWVSAKASTQEFDEREKGISKDERKSIQGGGVYWQAPSFLERLSRRHVSSFLSRRANELGIEITLKPGNPYLPTQAFVPSQDSEVSLKVHKYLTISYLSPRLFTLLLLAPSADAALVLGGPQSIRGGELGEFITSDDSLFRELFAPSSSPHHPRPSISQSLRASRSPLETRGCEKIPVPLSNALDPAVRDVTAWVPFIILLGTCFVVEWIEYSIWTIAGVKWASKHPETSSRTTALQPHRNTEEG